MLKLSSLFLLTLLALVSCKSNPPNIVLFLTDDLDSELDGLIPLKKVRDWFVENGRYYRNAFATTPICCPSRSSILTGLTQDHTKVWNNSISGNCASKDWIKEHEVHTFATFAKSVNYKTAYFGKYLNEYGIKDPLRVPQGWDHWVGLIGNSKYFNYTLSNNGILERHADGEKDYLTDVLKHKSLDYLKDHFASSTKDSPFLMVMATPSPHAPFTPAAKYAFYFSEEKAPRLPNFNYVQDKKHWLARRKPLSIDLMGEVDTVFKNRWRTLLSVDDMVDDIMHLLQQKKALDNTYVIFTSDHGYHLGQYGLPLDKRMPYETDIRIPFLLHGPGIKPERDNKDVVLNIDIAPTILDIMNIPPEKYKWMDGYSLLRNYTRKSFKVQYRGEHGNGIDKACNIHDVNMDNCYAKFGCNCQDSSNNTYICERTIDGDKVNTKHCWFNDDEYFQEIYDLSKDPYELHNLYTFGPEPSIEIVK